MPHRAELTKPHLDVRDLGPCGGSYVAAAGPAVGPESQQVFHFSQREPELLRAFDEPDDTNSLGGVLPVPRGTTLRNAEQAPSFVIPKRLGVHPRLSGDFTDAHPQPQFLSR